MIEKYGSIDGSTVPVIHGALKSGDTATYGTAIKIVAGEINSCAATDLPDGVYIGKSVDGADYVPIRKDDEFLIDIDGATALVVGTKTYTMDSTAKKLDSATATGGHICLLRKLGTKAVIKFV